MSYTPHNFYGQNVSRASRVIEVTDNDKNVLKDIYPKVLYFTAKWCGPCKQIKPFYYNFAESNTGITFFKIDVEDNEELTAAFNVRSMPTFVFFKSKQEYKVFTGADSKKLGNHIEWLKSA